MLKPKAVRLRICLWKFHNNIINDHSIPKSGLNFLVDDDLYLIQNFFYYVDLKNSRISMLE